MKVNTLAALAVAVTISVVAPANASTGIASFYGSGQATATGEHFDPNGLTAAMRDRRLFGHRVRVTNLRNHRAVVVRVNDYGPAAWTGRLIDLSYGAAKVIGMVNSGTAPVSVEVVA